MTLTSEDIDFIRNVKAEVEKRMYGLGPVIDLLLAALVSEGHVLLEGNPGLGKTALVRELTNAIGLRENRMGRMGRIQFTPDLMPADITGTEMPKADQPERLEFRRGPIFHWLLLADEINRATPKTQAAMLEAMAEQQVTTAGETRMIREPQDIPGTRRGGSVMPPFMVLATQNPIDHEGTFDLPEAQLDRFMFKIDMPFPDAEILGRIVDKETGPFAGLGEKSESRHLGSPADRQREDALDQREADGLVRLDALRQAVRRLEVLPLARRHAINMIQASNGQLNDGAVAGIGNRDRRDLDRLVKELLDFPLGPRAGTALLLGAKAMAIVALVQDDRPATAHSHTTEGLARIVVPVLRHRLKLVHRWEASWLAEFKEASDYNGRPSIGDVIRHFALLTAPVESGYREAFSDGLSRGAGARV